MEVILPATVATLKDSKVLKAMEAAGVDFGKAGYKEIVAKLEKEGFLKKVLTSGGREDYVTTEKGKDLSFTGIAGERFARTGSDGKIEPADRVETGDKSYQDIHGKITASLVPTPEELAAATAAGVEGGKQIKKAATKGVKDGLGMNSPASEITDVADGVAAGAREAEPEAIKAGEELGETISTSAAKTPRRKTTDGNVVPDPKTGQLVEQGKLDQMLIARQEGLARATAQTTNKISAFAAKASTASFAIGSVAGLFTMFGGKVGEFAGIIMQITLLFGGLAAATARLITAKNMEATMSLVQGLNDGQAVDVDLPGGRKGGVAKGGWMGGAKGKAGMAAFGKNIAELAKSLPVIGRIFAGIGTALAAAATALGVSVGLLVVAILAIVAVIVGSIVAYKMARDNVTRLGDVANMSAEKIDKFAELFGITARKSDFEGKFAGTTAATSEDRDKVEMVLEMENFEKDFNDQIQGIKNATQEEATTALQSLTTQLSASGFEEDAVEAIINAIAIKAGRKDLDLSFSSISFSSPEGLAAIDTVAKDTMTRLETAFAGRNIWDNLGIGEFTKQLDFASANFTTAFQSLQIGFREGEISAEDFMSSMTSLNTSITSLNPAIAKDLVNTLAKDLNIEKKVEGLDNFEDKLLLINAATAGIEIPEKVVRALAKASKAGASKQDLQTAVKLRTELRDLIEEETQALEDAKNAEEEKAIMTAAVQDAKVSIEEQVTALQNEATAYNVLMEAGWDAASAIDAVSDATIATALAMAATADERQGIINDLSALMALRREADARKESASGRGGGGGGSKSPMQEALESQIGRAHV
jgi:predicted transcriptional regulator